ncbi:MAG: type III PLP-dependent enzyme [Acidobacteriota bacterium]|jgi:ornithine decarboxylase|nr:type III PLP-dependent enzyme [Acidobacteriota bacterium]NLT31928.1 type III PLP-dependent enzyme [Acidobacteriota bacterium]
MKTSQLKELAKKHGTPLFVVDHEVLRGNFRAFRSYLPRVQPYYAVKANPDPEIIRTLFRIGSSFDVASIAEFNLVYENIRALPAEEQQDFIWNKVIYANPIKDRRTLEELDRYRPLVVYDNVEEIGKIRRHAPNAGLALRIRVPNTGSMVELSSKFGAAPGEAVDLMARAIDAGLAVEGLTFHVGSQCTNFDNYVQALATSAAIMEEAEARGIKLKLLDIGGGFPARYDRNVRPFRDLARILGAEIRRLFPKELEIIAEPGRYMVGTAATAVAEVIGKSERDGKRCYYINDGIYHTFSGILFDHCQYHLKAFKRGPKRISAVFGPTCDALDTVSRAEDLPELELGDLVYSENIGAYSHASSTWFNGFPPAQVVHINV